MNIDEYGISYCEENDLFDALYKNPDLDFSLCHVINPTTFNQSVKTLFSGHTLLIPYVQNTIPLSEFDKKNQSEWFMPLEYKEMDIAKWLLNMCVSDVEKQRVSAELLLYMQHDLFDLLKMLKYMVDTFRNNNVIWGLGRGSSVASYVLFLIGVHKIDSIYYDLDIAEFFHF